LYYFDIIKSENIVISIKTYFSVLDKGPVNSTLPNLKVPERNILETLLDEDEKRMNKYEQDRILAEKIEKDHENWPPLEGK
jgi:hypothetical protein